MDKRRSIFAFLLTVIILPAILVTSFHHHVPAREMACVDCAHHIPHGHLGGDTATDECLVCQFISLSWIGEAQHLPLIPEGFISTLEGTTDSGIPASDLVHRCPRAPPVIF